MSPTIYRYPLDGTGISPDNLVVNEEHQLSNRTIRCVAPTYGGFFATGVKVVDANTNVTLVHGRNADYVFGELFEFPTGRYGKEIFGLIVIKKPGVTKVKITYHALGGDYSYSMDAIIAMIDNLNLGERPTAWPDILGKPLLYDPASHFHDLGDIYGFEYVVHAIERLRAAVLMGDTASHDEIYQYIDDTSAELTAAITDVRDDLHTHIADKTNPHSTTKAQVGLGKVQDYAIATVAEMDAGDSNTTYVTPFLVDRFVTTNAVTPLNTHINNKLNPHQVTKAQVGLSSVDNYATANDAIAATGTSNTNFMTPRLVRVELQRLAITPINEHIADKSNPHATTKAQVGLGLVENYAPATDAIAAAGTSNTNYMTPRLVRVELQRLAITPLDNHIDDVSNPHNTTKAQVGLGNVLDYGVATQAQMDAGVATNVYLTPNTVKTYVNNMAVTPLTNHINNVANPHATTKAQVGLGSVLNYPVATQDQMNNGIAAVYVTPPVVIGYIAASVLTPLNAHINNTANPHNTTKAQVGLGNVQNYGTAVQADMNTGTAANLYVTPNIVATYVTQSVYQPLQTHIADKTNPHQVTKAQVGLGNVENYPVATNAISQAGTSNTHYVTPGNLSYTLELSVFARYDPHINSTGNPHQVTKAQVGLSNVQNYGMASVADAQAGVSNSVYITPAALRYWTDATFDSYHNSYHASITEARAGVSDVKFVTPYHLVTVINEKLANYYTKAQTDAAIAAALANITTVFTYGNGISVYNYSSTIGDLVDTANFFDVFPPSGKTMSDLAAFIPSISKIFFAGDVDGNDTIRCTWTAKTDRITVWVSATEQRAKGIGNWLAVWN